MLPLTSRHRDRIVDREVMKLRLREAKHGERQGRQHSVLVAVELDDSEAAATAVAAAGVLATEMGAEVVLAGVVPAVQPAGAHEPLVSHQLTEAATHLPAGIPHRTVLCWGAPGPAIVDVARQEAVDMVVVSMRDGYVLHHSDVPVLVVAVEPPPDAAA
jgi:methylmalonyl-CoA mutase cobalamin-binding subunit